MSIALDLAWMTAGVLVGIGLAVFVLPGWRRFRDPMLKAILKTNQELGWLLIQNGNNYQLEPVKHRDGDTVWVGDKNESLSYDDPSGLMQTLHGVPIGLVREPFRAVGDVASADAGRELAARADGGELKEEDTVTVDDLKDRLVVGFERGAEDDETYCYVNPWMEDPNPPQVTDLRDLVEPLSFAGKSDTPRKAAQNAKEAERAFDRFSGLKSQGMLLAAFILGAITTEYIAGSSGGGGGGGGINVPMPWLNPVEILSAVPF